MAGDRSDYRHFYPQILNFNEADAQRILDAGIPQYTTAQEYIKYLRGLAEDTECIRHGITMVAWPEQDSPMVNQIRRSSVEICLFRLAQISAIAEVQTDLAIVLGKLGIRTEVWEKRIEDFPCKLTESALSPVKLFNRNWKEVFLEVPVERMFASYKWERPFDAVNATLSEGNFPVLQDQLDEMHSRILRGHGWFGVGEWNIANRQYLAALSIALSTNNTLALEALVRFLVDTYTAVSDFQSAVNITEDFLHSAMPKARLGNKMTREMFEAIIVAYAFAKQWDKSKEWLERISTVPNAEPSVQVDKWNIVELLRDVHVFRKNGTALSLIDSVVNELVNCL